MAKKWTPDGSRSLLDRLKADAGKKTFGELIQEREAAACEIERLIARLAAIGDSGSTAKPPGRVTAVPAGPWPVSHAKWQDRALLRLSDVCEIVGLSRSTIYGRMADGQFPRPIRVSERSVRWRSADVAEWIRSPRY